MQKPRWLLGKVETIVEFASGCHPRAVVSLSFPSFLNPKAIKLQLVKKRTQASGASNAVRTCYLHSISIHHTSCIVYKNELAACGSPFCSYQIVTSESRQNQWNLRVLTDSSSLLFLNGVWGRVTIHRTFSFTPMYLLVFFFSNVDQWLDYTPEWCGSLDNRREIQWGDITEEECKQACSDCAAIEYWSGGAGYCFECLDHTKRKPQISTEVGGYPPHVFVRQW